MGDERAELFGGAVLAVERGENPFAFHLHECGDPRSDLADCRLSRALNESAW